MPLLHSRRSVCLCVAQDSLLYGKALLCSHCGFGSHLSTQSISSYFCGHVLLVESVGFVFIHFNEFLTASGWEGNIQLHLDAVYHLGGARKKS